LQVLNPFQFCITQRDVVTYTYLITYTFVCNKSYKEKRYQKC